MRILFLDNDIERHQQMDKRHPDDEVHHAYTVEAFRRYVENNDYDIISLDHDLGIFTPSMYGGRECEVTGMDAVRVLVDHINSIGDWGKPNCVIVHSWNPIGARNMMKALQDAGIVAYQAMFMYEE